jgi:hypothetical protein
VTRVPASSSNAIARAAMIPPPTTKHDSLRSLTRLAPVGVSNLCARIESRGTAPKSSADHRMAAPR